MKLKFLMIIFLGLLVLSSVNAESLILRPNANGYYSNWTKVGCNSSAGWQCVDEVGFNYSDYVYSSSDNMFETFNIEDINNVSINNITYVTVCYLTKRYVSNKYVIIPILRDSITGLIGEGAGLSVTSTWTQSCRVYANNPFTGQPWNITSINTLEVGMKTLPMYNISGGSVARIYTKVDYA